MANLNKIHFGYILLILYTYSQNEFYKIKKDVSTSNILFEKLNLIILIYLSIIYILI